MYIHRVFAKLYMYVSVHTYIYIKKNIYLSCICKGALPFQLPCSLDHIQRLVFLLVSQHQQAVRGIPTTRPSRFLQGHAPRITCSDTAKMFVKGMGKNFKASRKLPF